MELEQGACGSDCQADCKADQHGWVREQGHPPVKGRMERAHPVPGDRWPEVYNRGTS